MNKELEDYMLAGFFALIGISFLSIIIINLSKNLLIIVGLSLAIIFLLGVVMYFLGKLTYCVIDWITNDWNTILSKEQRATSIHWSLRAWHAEQNHDIIFAS